MERMRRGLAIVEFFAVEDEIQKLRSQKYGITLTYEKLKEEGKIKMSYKTFYGHLKKYEKENEEKKQLQKKEKKKPLKREQASSKMVFENAPDKQKRHF